VRLSMREALDYKDCPQLYKFRHVDFLPERRDIKSYFKQKLRQTISHYYFCMIDKREKSLNNIFSKWEQLWFCPEVEESFQESDIRDHSNKAISLLRNFHQYTKDERIVPVAVDFRYEASFDGETNLHVTGKIDLIKVLNDKTRNKETDLVFFSYSNHMPDEFLSKININTAVAAYAFRKNFESRESNVILCNIGKKHETVIQMTGSDFVRAKKILYNIAEGIENRIFFPSDNKQKCGKCSFRTFCMNEKAMEDRDAISKRHDN